MTPFWAQKNLLLHFYTERSQSLSLVLVYLFTSDIISQSWNIKSIITIFFGNMYLFMNITTEILEQRSAFAWDTEFIVVIIVYFPIIAKKLEKPIKNVSRNNVMRSGSCTAP